MLFAQISCILCIFADGNKAPPIFVFKGVPDANLEKRSKKTKEVLKGNIFISCQKNAWVDTSIFFKWSNEIWFRTYNFRKSTENNILYFDCAKSHLSEDIKNLFVKNRCYYRLIPPGLTSICQPLDLCVNKPSKMH